MKSLLDLFFSMPDGYIYIFDKLQISSLGNSDITAVLFIANCNKVNWMKYYRNHNVCEYISKLKFDSNDRKFFICFSTNGLSNLITVS